MADWAMEGTHGRIEDKTGCEVLDHVQHNVMVSRYAGKLFKTTC